MLPGKSFYGTFVLTALFIILAGLISPSFSAPPKYRLINLGTDLWGDYHVLDMNNRNQVVGYLFVNFRNGFVWRNGKVTLLPSLCDSCECIAEGINDSGIIAGYAYTQPGVGDDDFRIFHAVLWDTNNVITDLGTMGGYRSAAFDINRSGQVAGFYSVVDKGYHEHVYLWEKGAYHELAPGPGSKGYDATTAYNGVYIVRNDVRMNLDRIGYYVWTFADEITLNNNGDVASHLASGSNLSYSILWKHQGEQIDLNAQFIQCHCDTNNVYVPMDMNDSGVISGCDFHWVVTGYFSPLQNRYIPFVWMSPTVCYDQLECIISELPLASYINNKGTITGAYDNSPLTARAVIWEKGSFFPLNDCVVSDTQTSYNLKTAKAINDSGAIAGDGVINNNFTAFLLVPISPQIVMPTLGKFTITLTQASAKLVSDVYLYRPDSVLMIQNNLKNVGKTYDTIYPAGTALEFAILVHPLPGKGQPYWFYSDSKHARVTKANDSLWYINFEDLPDSIADWDYNDVVLKVEMHFLGPLPSKPANPGGLSMPLLGMSRCVEAYDVRGRMLGMFFVDSRGRLSDKSGRPAYGVHIIKSSDNTVAHAGRRILNIR
jgi:hypothetical protein